MSSDGERYQVEGEIMVWGYNPPFSAILFGCFVF
jgi:hypothetical protein